jgi:amidase
MGNFKEYNRYDALGLAKLVRNGDVSPIELLTEAKERLDEINTRFNAVTYISDELSNSLLKRLNKEAIFCGVPFLVKDLMLPFKGMPLSNGMKAMMSYVPNENSAMADLLNASGLITFGKTNTSELGASPLTNPAAYGETLNPWDITKNAGGSSGGSTVVVATRVVPMAYSSDGGGSIRLPASYCGIFGYKPSRGINQYEDISQAWGGAVVSHVSTVSVRDSAAYLDTVSGNVKANYSVNNPMEGSYLYSVTCKKRLKIALIIESPTQTPVHPNCINAVVFAAEECEKLDHSIEQEKWNFDTRELMRAFMTVVMYYTHRDIRNIASMLGVSEKSLDMELNTKFMSLAGSTVDRDLLEGSLDIWKKASQSLSELHKQYDVILTPTVATPPLEGDALAPNPLEKLIMNIIVFTELGELVVNNKALNMAIDKSLYALPVLPIANITGQPAMSVPLYWDDDNLPHGAHFMADVGQDSKLFMLAGQLEEACPWVNKVPNHNNL